MNHIESILLEIYLSCWKQESWLAALLMAVVTDQKRGLQCIGFPQMHPILLNGYRWPKEQINFGTKMAPMNFIDQTLIIYGPDPNKRKPTLTNML